MGVPDLARRVPSGMSPENCIRIRGELQFSTHWAGAEGAACFEYRDLIGIRLGGDATTGYATAINMMLEELDAYLQRTSKATSRWRRAGEQPP